MNKDVDKFKVGIYIRLSREDDDKVLESESVTNQRSLLFQYIKENHYCLVDSYIDDGYSGTNFERPAFKRLLRDIETGKINMVITKDMSRLGRDYIGTGNLLEKYFPEHGVRFIAITDNIDTFLDGVNNDVAPFKAILNDMYAKDISKKIRSSLRAKQKLGKFVGGRAPFGYEIDPKDKNHFIIQEEQARVVRRIYNMSRSGLTYYAIAKQLTLENVKTPAQYYKFEWKGHYSVNYGVWHPKTIQDILTNQMYIGHMVQNRRKKMNYKIKKVVKNPPQDYVVVENTHQAIIDVETFYEVQRGLPKNVGRMDKKENHLLDGLLYCGDCNHRISITPRRKKGNKCYTICNYYRTYPKKNVCTTHSNNYDQLEKEILSSIWNFFQKRKNESFIRGKIKKNNFIQKEEKERKYLEEKINQNEQCLDELYLDFLKKKIELDRYERMKIRIEKEIRCYQDTLKGIKSRKLKNEKNFDIEKYVDDFLSMEKMNRKLVLAFIDKIEIFKNNTIRVTVSFSES